MLVLVVFASAIIATARLDGVPTELVIGSSQPFTASAGSPMDPKPTLYMIDQNGDTVNHVGSVDDPWIVTATKYSGIGKLIGNLTCEFNSNSSLCVFENLIVVREGEGFSIEFELTYPGNENIIPAISEVFDVGGRKMSAKFTELATLNPMNLPFPAVVTIWDDATDMPADPIDIPTDITCSISVLGHNSVELNGTLTVPVTDGEAVFAVGTEEPITNAKFGVTCENPSLEFVAIAISDYFNIYPYPKTGSVRDATAVFTYEGKRNTEIDSVLNALADIVGITMETA